MDLVPSSYRTENEFIDCPCRTDHNSFMIQCDGCYVWYHGICINLTEEEAWFIDEFFCHTCQCYNPALSTTLKRLCWTPSCNKVAKKNSHYCERECGLRQVMPNTHAMTVHDFRSPSNVSRFVKSLRSKLEIQDAKIVQLLLIVQRSKNSPADTVCRSTSFKSEDVVVHCRLCLAECSLSDYHSHLGSCFLKNPIVIPPVGKSKPNDPEWNIFCNRDGCRQLRVLCTKHYRSDKDDAMICGFPLEMDLGSTIGTFCGFLKMDCWQHPYYWEELRRAEFDLDKLQVLLNLSELEKESTDKRKASLKRKVRKQKDKLK